MTPAPKRGSRSRPSTIALEESAGRRPRKRTRSTNSLPLSSEPPSVVLSTLNNRSRSLPRSNATKLLDRRVDGPPEDSKVPILSDRMAPDSTAVETQPLSSGALENLNGPPRPSLSGTRRKHNGHASDRDSESSLSDIGEDSEAETERLHNSPLKQRPKFVQHRKDSTSTTQAIAIEMPVRKEVLLDHGDTFADDAADDSTPSTPTQSSPSKKRKRDFQESPIVRPTEEPKTRPSTPPPKKKIHTPQVPSENGSVSTLEGKKPNSDDDENPAITNGVRQETPVAIVTNGKDIRPVKSIVKVATPAVEESDSNPDQDQESERAIGIEIEENTGVAVPIVPEEEHGDAVDTIGVDDEERALKKKAAMEELAEIERVFAHLKDRIYSEKLRRVEIEMKMIQDGTHPEYVAQKACIDQKLDEKERLADAQYKNGMESLEIATRVTKAQVHSQYYQRVRELRENTLNKCSELWYHIQRERRAGDTLVSEYTYRIPDRASTRIQHRKQYNWEVALLTGISKHIGFPAAPDVLGASEEERAEDLEAIGIAPRVPVRASATVQPPVLRDRLLDDHYERPQPIHWSQVQRHSPPSPAPQPVQAHSHPHVHIHHHHNRRHAAPGVSNQPDQPLLLKQRVPSATGSANPGHSQPSNVQLSALLQNDIKQEHSSPRPPSSLALSIHGGNNQNRSPQLVHNHPQSHPSQRPLQYNYSGHPMPSHPLQPPSHQHHSLYPRASSIESHPAPPSAPQRIIDLGSPATGERIYGREVEAPDGGLKRLKEESDGSLGIPTTAMRFPSRMSGF